MGRLWFPFGALALLSDDSFGGSHGEESYEGVKMRSQLTPSDDGQRCEFERESCLRCLKP